MTRVKNDVRNCRRCKKPFYRDGGNTDAKYCSRTCACRDRNTKEHQSRAGKVGGGIKIALRGTGTKGYIKEFGRHQHRIVVEKKLGRKLIKGEIIHHIDGNKHNNKEENLKVVTRAEHARIHFTKKRT